VKNFLEHNFESKLRIAMEIVRKRRHLSIYQAYYQLNKDEISNVLHTAWFKHVKTTEAAKEALESQATAEQDLGLATKLAIEAAMTNPMSWVNWLQSYIKQMIDTDRKPTNCTDWDDRKARAEFLSINGYPMGTEKPVRPTLSAEEIER
jgi:hypothetical protein